ncbi:hypothetical protein [Actinoplanes sp. NPDC026670]
MSHNRSRIRQGIDIDDDAVAAEVGHRWRNPIWRHDDGSFAEWRPRTPA